MKINEVREHFDLLNNVIAKNGSFILSSGTLNVIDLLSSSHEMLNTMGINSKLRVEIENLFEPKEGVYDLDTEDSLPQAVWRGSATIADSKLEEANELWNEDVFDYFNEIAPEGYSFASSEGDSSLIGWFRIEEEIQR